MSPAAFRELKTRKDIDRALPRLVAAATLTEAFGYAEILLTERELGPASSSRQESRRGKRSIVSRSTAMNERVAAHRATAAPAVSGSGTVGNVPVMGTPIGPTGM